MKVTLIRSDYPDEVYINGRKRPTEISYTLNVLMDGHDGLVVSTVKRAGYDKWTYHSILGTGRYALYSYRKENAYGEHHVWVCRLWVHKLFGRRPHTLYVSPYTESRVLKGKP